MANFSIIYRSNRDSPGTLVLMCNHNRTCAKRSIDVHLDPEQWDPVQHKVVRHPRAAAVNAHLASILSDASLRVLDLSATQRLRSLTAHQLLDIVMADDVKAETFFTLTEAFITLKRADSTKDLYRRTMASLSAFDRKADTRFMEDLTIDYLNRFDAWLQSHGTPSPNARGIHFRNIRAVFNYAIDEGKTAFYPFRKFHIPSCETPHRAIPVEKMREFFSRSDRESMIFCLSFCLQGINLVDLADLTKSNIVGGRVEYYRRKTGKFYSVLLTPEAEALMEKLKGRRHLINIKDTASCAANAKTFINKKIKDVCPEATYYSARHSFATYLNDLGVPREVISEALGHEYGSKITSIYIKPNQQAVDDALRKVLDYVCGEGLTRTTDSMVLTI